MATAASLLSPVNHINSTASQKCKSPKKNFASLSKAMGAGKTTLHTDSFNTNAQDRNAKFRLEARFVDRYTTRPSPFGFNGLGELVYRRTYSRVKADGTNEQWFETVERVVNGTFNMQKRWILENELGWDEQKAQTLAMEMYDRIFTMKFLPPGRGLWAMGSPLTEDKKLYAALNNCAFVSTEQMAADPSKAFLFLMDASMLGVGVGFDTKGAGKFVVPGPDSSKPTTSFVIPDSREGWVDSLKSQLDSYFKHLAPVVFDYSLIRPAGQAIKGFGGTSSGPEALRVLHDEVEKVLSGASGKPISSTVIVDIMNMIGKCVVAGNVRRTAEIAFGEASDEEYIDLKNYEKNPHRMSYGWTSNNSIFATVGMDYSESCKRAVVNGEPGFAWLDNMQKYDRMNGVITNKDHRARGGNPCLEQTLEPYEMCCLVETFPHLHEDLEDFIETLRMAFLYAKTVTLGKTHWPETNRVLLRNRRIGCSMSGIAQFISARGMEQLREWSETGYDALQQIDQEYSSWFAIPRSIKTTSIKPSGTVSLLAGAAPGVHYPISRFYLRRVRLPKDSDLVNALREAGYHIEPAVGSESTTLVVSFPIDCGDGVRKAKEISMWEQLSLAAFMQRHWADNQVSCTVTFDPVTEGPQMKHALDIFQYQLKGISFLPQCDFSVYPQMPYEEITEEQYNTLRAGLSPVDYSRRVSADPVAERFCDGDKCTL